MQRNRDAMIELQSVKKAVKSVNEKRNRPKIDLAFPTVVISSSSAKARKKRKNRNLYQFLTVLGLCLIVLFHFIDRTIRLPPADLKLDLTHVKSIEDLSIDSLGDLSWCLEPDNHDTCSCSNPLFPEGRQEDFRWEKV